MKEGKSITQFPRQELLTGDELFLVNQKQNDGTYVSRMMRLSTLRNYIIEQGQDQIYFLITENDEEPQLDEQPIITEDDDHIICVL